MSRFATAAHAGACMPAFPHAAPLNVETPSAMHGAAWSSRLSIAQSIGIARMAGAAGTPELDAT